MKQVTVTKSYGRTISQDYQSFRFEASLTETFEVIDDNDLSIKSMELFNKVRMMVETDIQNVFGGQK